MRRALAPALVLALVVSVAGCAGGGADPAPETPRTEPIGPGTGPGGTIGGTLTAEVFPFEAPAAAFTTSQRGEMEVRLEPYEGGTAMWITADGLAARRIDWKLIDGSIYCSDGPDRRVEFLRLGAAPGSSWESSGRTIRFDGWERVQTPAGSFDAVRISSTLYVQPYSEVETWWFAPEHGLVQMRLDKGELYSMEMKRLR